MLAHTQGALLILLKACMVLEIKPRLAVCQVSISPSILSLSDADVTPGGRLGIICKMADACKPMNGQELLCESAALCSELIKQVTTLQMWPQLLTRFNRTAEGGGTVHTLGPTTI